MLLLLLASSYWSAPLPSIVMVLFENRLRVLMAVGVPVLGGGGSWWAPGMQGKRQRRPVGISHLHSWLVQQVRNWGHLGERLPGRHPGRPHHPPLSFSPRRSGDFK